ncbi:hypothetical protein HID58_079968 [Brassica napus]|uniref:AP180 N-terminal homology (ANTH) domain-containing protein n=1 Tax=Brassica napus TaxID=3708 RepID=A0ABQ7Y3J5_BRANA|nr:hypothetical protein HID58_079968 [Brassica napus]
MECSRIPPPLCLAKANSEFKDLYIAIGKATNYIEYPPKERHVRKIFSAISVIQPQPDGVYSIHALSKRLSKTRTWFPLNKILLMCFHFDNTHVAMKVLIIVERKEKKSFHRRHILKISKLTSKMIQGPLPRIALLGVEHMCSFSKSGMNVIIGRAFGKSLRCSFQGDNNPGYDIPGAFMLITLLYGSYSDTVYS